MCVSTLLQLGERCTKRGDGLWGKRQAHGAQKLTRECALCVVSEPEASPYCVSPRVAFVSALVAPIVFCPHTCHPTPPPTTPLLFRPPRLFRESRPACKREEERRGEERLVSLSLSADKGNWCALVSRATPFLHSDCLLAARRLFLDGEISV